MSEKHLCICNICTFEENLEVVGRYGDDYKEPKGWSRININGKIIDLCYRCRANLKSKNFDDRKQEIIQMLKR